MYIRKYDYVLIDDGMKFRIHKVVDSKIQIKKCKLNLLFLVNKKYGSTFTYISDKWVRCKKKKATLEISNEEEIKGTNKDIFHKINSQQLTEEDILELKKANKGNPNEIIQQIIDHSATFKEKTEISKFKYIERKLKRFFCQFTVYECNIVNLMNFYYKFYPYEISFLRMDYLASIIFHLNRNFVKLIKNETMSNASVSGVQTDHLKMNESNTYEAQHVMIYDGTCGVLTGVLNICFNNNVNIYSLLYKNVSNSLLSSFGIKNYSSHLLKIKIVHPDDKIQYKPSELYLKPSNEIVRLDSCGNPVNLFSKMKEQRDSSIAVLSNSELKGEKPQKRKLEIGIEHTVENDEKKVKLNSGDLIKTENENEKESIYELKKSNKNIDDMNTLESQKNMISALYEKKMDTVIIILSSAFLYKYKIDVYFLINTLVKFTLTYADNDSKIIIHTDDFMLVNIILEKLQKSESFINIKLNEYILRKQQVINRRTHPVITNAKLADGFLITAIKVQS